MVVCQVFRKVIFCNMLSYAWRFNLHNNSFDIFESDYLPFYGTFLRHSEIICKNFCKGKNIEQFSYTLLLYILHIHFDEFRELSAFSRFIPYIVPNLIHSMCCAALFLYSRNFQKTAVKRQVYFIKSVLYFGQLSEKIAFAALESGMSVSIRPILCRNASHRVRRKIIVNRWYRIRMLISLRNRVLHSVLFSCRERF